MCIGSLMKWISMVEQLHTLALADARRTLPAGLHSVDSKVRWRRDSGLFFRVWAHGQNEDHKYMTSLVQRWLTSTPPNTFGMNWNIDCWTGLLIQPQILYLLNLNSHRHTLKFCGNPLQKNVGCYSHLGWRSEARRVVTECLRMWSSRWSASH